MVYKVWFTEFNSGGYYVLSKMDYEGMESAGWEVDTEYRYATKTFDTVSDCAAEEMAKLEFENITGFDADLDNCPCCGKSFSFYCED